jgi:hypothetical protein
MLMNVNFRICRDERSELLAAMHPRAAARGAGGGHILEIRPAAYFSKTKKKLPAAQAY